MKLYLVRHGECMGNISANYSRDDEPLTENGIKQSLLTRDFLNDVTFSRCYASPLHRVKMTIDIILSDRNVPSVEERLITERELGRFKGNEKLELELKLREVKRSFATYRPKNGENYFDVYDRTKKFWEKIKLSEPPESTLLIVSHSCPLVGIIANIIKRQNEAMLGQGLKNCSVSYFDYDAQNDKVLDAYANNTLHLFGGGCR